MYCFIALLNLTGFWLFYTPKADDGGESESTILQNAEEMLEKCMDLILRQMVGGQRDTTVKTSRAVLIAGNTFLGEMDDSM